LSVRVATAPCGYHRVCAGRPARSRTGQKSVRSRAISFRTWRTLRVIRIGPQHLSLGKGEASSLTQRTNKYRPSVQVMSCNPKESLTLFLGNGREITRPSPTPWCNSIHIPASTRSSLKPRDNKIRTQRLTTSSIDPKKSFHSLLQPAIEPIGHLFSSLPRFRPLGTKNRPFPANPQLRDGLAGGRTP
jgi:hypothetical protein